MAELLVRLERLLERSFYGPTVYEVLKNAEEAEELTNGAPVARCFVELSHEAMMNRNCALELSAQLLERWRPNYLHALAMITEIEEQAAARRSRTGSQPLGASRVRGQHPHDRPARSKRSPAPAIHAVSARVRREFWVGHSWFVSCFRTAAEKLREGDRAAPFPAGSFPPALPFVSG